MRTSLLPGGEALSRQQMIGKIPGSLLRGALRP